MPEKVVSVRLQARVEGFTAGMRKAKASVDDLTKADVPKAAKGYKNLADNAALAGLAVAAGVGLAVKRFADFDKAMSAVRANSGATSKELEALRASAIKLGADSQFTATEAAQGINELAKAGISTADVLNGGLKGALDLAAAGQLSVASAAETTASAMTQFKLKGDQATHVADLLANGANKAQGGVGDLGAALAQSGLVAASTGLTIEETTAGLTAFASAGLIGSDAGTSFKTMLQRLNAPSAEASKEMAQLGISAYDSQGNFVGLANVAEQLKNGLKDLTPEQRNSALATIFGSDAIRAANVLYEQGATGINKWTEAVSVQGAAAKQAADLTDNLSGDLERLGGAFDTVLIQGGSGANSALRTLTQGLEGVVNQFGKVPGPLLLAGAALTSVALLAPKGIRAYREYTTTLDSVGLSFDKIAAKGPRAAKAVNAVTGSMKGFGAAAAVLAAAGAVDSIFGTDSSRPGSDTLIKDFSTAGDAVDAFSKRLSAYSDQSSNWFSVDGVKSYSDVIHNTFDPGLSDQIDHAVGSIGAFFGITDKSRITSSADALKDLDASLAGMVASGNVDGAARTYQQFADAAARGGVKADDFKAKLPGYTNALSGVDLAAKGAAGSTGLLAGATDDANTAAETAKTALKNLKDALDGLGSPVAQQRAAQRGFQSSVNDSADALKTYRESLVAKRLKDKGYGTDKGDKAVTDKATKSAEAWADAQIKAGKAAKDTSDEAIALQGSLDGINDATKTSVSAAFEAAGGYSNLDAATKAATDAMKVGRGEFIKAATQAGYTKKQANDLADALGLIPDDVKIAVSQSGAAEAGAAIDQAARDRTAIITVKRRIADYKAKQENDANAYGPTPPPPYNRKNVATGGAIYGPGTGTSDSIPAWLSNGEHVLTAAEVAKLGGQSAVYAMRAAIRAGHAPGFASGGAVAARYAPSVSYAGPTSYSTRNDYGLTADSVTIVADDPRAFKREIRTAPYRAKSKPGRNP